MRAVVARDGEMSVRDEPEPALGERDVLVKVHAAGLNGADMLQRVGKYPPPPGTPNPDVLGMELAGEVVENGAGAGRFKPGERVMAIVATGAQAQLAAVPESLLMPVPDALDLTAAGGVPEVFTTAHDAIFTQAGLQPGERLLVHGAAGGVGTAAVQLGHAVGAYVVATVRNPDHRAAVANLGADSVIDPEGFAEAGPFDVILELVGAPNMPGNLQALATGGRIAVIGTGAGREAELNLGLLMSKRGRIHGSTLRARPLELKAQTARAMERDVLPLFERRAIEVPIAATYPLEQAVEAYDRFAAGGKLGKIILTV
ncbi:MAG TPA: zinc-binding dehydrogenase [Solirubrobacteraceae bacterium]|nr:zinc-binding dehydrogenase [Solirubrobacteraceae bacterium]